MKKNKFIFYLFLFLLFLFNFAILNNFSGDNYFNYGFSYNIANGMIPYRDFNMVLFPFSCFLMASIMKIFGSKLIVYYAFYSFVYVLIVYLTNKLSKSITPFIIFILFTFSIGGYNVLSILLFLLLMYFEKREKNDYIVGIILGLSIMNNQKMALLLIPALLYKDYHRIFKRLVGIIIPFQFLLIYLYNTLALSDFIDYTILGLFDFGNGNLRIGWWAIVAFALIITISYRYWKTKDLKWLYSLAFLLLAFPIFDSYHVAYAAIPFIFFSCASEGLTYKIVKYIFTFFIGVLFLVRVVDIFSNNAYSLNLDSHNNYYLTVSFDTVDKISEKINSYYNDKIDDYDIHFIFWDTYYYKYKNNIKIDKFDLSLIGNSGYNGNEKMKKKIKQMDNNTLFIIFDNKYDDDFFDQTNYELIDFIKENYEMIDDLGYHLYVYQINN